MTEPIGSLPTSPGLGAITDAGRRLAILAMDQGGSLRSMLSAAGRPHGDPDLRAFKVDVVAALSPLATGVLLDSEWGIPAVRAAGALAPDVGLLVSADPARRQTHGSEPRTVHDPSRGAAWAAGLGGSALKFAVRWRPDRPVADGVDLAAEAFEAATAVVADCRTAGLPCVIEPLVHALPGETLTAAGKEALVVESARRLAALQPDLLKLEWPGPAGCREVTRSLDGVPWALLSAGVPFETFVQHLRTAVRSGARGFIAGRAIWSEATTMDSDERRSFRHDVARRQPQLLAVPAHARAGVTA